MVLLASVKNLAKLGGFVEACLYNSAHALTHTHTHAHAHTHMDIASVTGVDKLLYSLLVVVSAVFNEALVLKALKCFNG